MPNKILTLLCVSCFCLLILESGFGQDQNSRPNIVYILLDDAGFGDLSCYGQEKFSTPNIDRMAMQGMKFSQHYAGSTVCAPTRCCLMTGVHTGHAFVRGNREVKPEGQAEMPGDIVTIPRLLRKAGYQTGCFGKWGLGAPGSASDPMEHFDEFFGYNCQRLAHNYYPTHLWKNREKVAMDGQTHSSPVIHEASLEFIRKNRDRPFFAFLSVTIPHAAMHVPASYSQPFESKFPQFADKIGKYKGPEVKNPIAAFAGMMTLMDEQVGEILALLKELDIDENTVVMLSSDNGPHKEGGHDPLFFDSNGPLRGHKRDLYEGGIRVPLIARWPGMIPENSSSDHISAHWDMLPTFCELAQAEVPFERDGISMVQELLGHSAKQKKHPFLYWEFYEQGGKKAVRFDQYKAIQLNINRSSNSPIAIYDLSKDIQETQDVSRNHPELVKKAEAMMQQAHTASPLWKFGPRKKKKRK